MPISSRDVERREPVRSRLVDGRARSEDARDDLSVPVLSRDIQRRDAVRSLRLVDRCARSEELDRELCSRVLEVIDAAIS